MGFKQEDHCVLCGKRANLEHILSSCSVALQQGRYRWRHDKVLKVLAATIDIERRKMPKPAKNKYIMFVKSGGKAEERFKSQKKGQISPSNDWQLKVDLLTKLVFPPEIAVTNLRPGMVMWSNKCKQVVLLELTVPWEERMSAAYERKKSKYTDLKNLCEENGWKVWCEPVEVGCRGFVSNTVRRAANILGIQNQQIKKLIKDCSEEAERASSWLWLKREEKIWQHQG